MPIELEIPSLRVLLENEVKEIDWLQSLYNELALLDERRLKAMEHNRAYQKRMARAFDKKVKPRDIKVGDLVLKMKPLNQSSALGKWAPVWVGPFLLKKIGSGGAMQLTDLDGNPFLHPINGDKLRRNYI